MGKSFGTEAPPTQALLPLNPISLKDNRGILQGMFGKVPAEETIVPGHDMIRMQAVGFSLMCYRTLELWPS